MKPSVRSGWLLGGPAMCSSAWEVLNASCRGKTVHMLCVYRSWGVL